MLLFATAVPSIAQVNCSTLNPAGSTSIYQQVLSFLADKKVHLAGCAIGIVGQIKGDEQIKAIGDVVDMINQVAESMKKESDLGWQTTGLSICTTQPVIVPLGYNSLTIIGRSPDIEALRAGSQPKLNDLLKPYQNDLGTFPNQPRKQVDTFLPPGGSSDWAIATLSGTVFDERENPRAGAVVTLTPSSSTRAQPQAMMTLDDGRYLFVDGPGEYFISARLGSFPGGELSSGPETVTLTQHPTLPYFDLYLHPPTRTGANQ